MSDREARGFWLVDDGQGGVLVLRRWLAPDPGPPRVTVEQLLARAVSRAGDVPRAARWWERPRHGAQVRR